MAENTNALVIKHLKTMLYETLNGQSKGGQLIMRPKDRLLRQIEELREIVLDKTP